MDKIVESLARLDNSLRIFRQEYALHYPDDIVSGKWTIRGILRHLTYWHSYYVKNISAQVKGKKHLIPRIKLQILNQQGISEMEGYSDKKLLLLLAQAQKDLGDVILKNKVREMTYREGNKPYTILHFLFLVNRHIGSHTRAIMRKRK